MMDIVERVAAKMAKQAECNHDRKATGFGYACKGLGIPLEHLLEIEPSAEQSS